VRCDGEDAAAMARYRIDPERSQVWIDARSNVHPIHTSTDGLEGFIDIELGPDGDVAPGTKPAGKLSLPVSRLKSNNRMEEREMHKRIEARKFPTIDGVLDTMEPTGADGSYKVSGDVTFRGVVRHHEDEMTVRPGDDGSIELAGASSFDIREFGMEAPRVLMLKVEPEVTVRVEIRAVEEA
jgi:polyisoprenoid-binding protein YceI